MPTTTMSRGQRPRPVPVRTIPLGRLADRPWPGKLTDAGLDVKAVIEDLDHYYVASDVTARTRCIDGRHDPELDENHLGPQVPGGAPGAALAHRLGVDETLLPLPSQEVDRHRFVMARVMITIATLMVLTDGTLPLLARVPG